MELVCGILTLYVCLFVFMHLRFILAAVLLDDEFLGPKTLKHARTYIPRKLSRGSSSGRSSGAPNQPNSITNTRQKLCSTNALQNALQAIPQAIPHIFLEQ